MRKQLRRPGRRRWHDAGFYHAYWPQIDGAIRMRIKRLLNNTSRDRTCGVGKPVPLKYAMGGT
ncbi:type II toxin-antitoxin system YoeB family toxin [Ferrimicrobium acidiphilum]|uniref:type II toxin-antitoxin system YoeB family toxin n=1 Tax=Ferrimicrobium acidiphilum TaxID=121039 RepID=UPI0034DF4726